VIFQNISSGVYLHIRQHLLAPTAVSLFVGILPNMLIKDIFLSVMAFLALYDMQKQKSRVFLWNVFTFFSDCTGSPARN